MVTLSASGRPARETSDHLQYSLRNAVLSPPHTPWMHKPSAHVSEPVQGAPSASFVTHFDDVVSQ
jgi:hypothetical protein